MTLKEQKEFVAARYDPDDVVEALELTSEQLLEAFEVEFENNIHKFEVGLGDEL